MALKTDIRGMVHIYPDYFVVGREKVREYAKAVKSTDPANYDEQLAAELGHPNLLAPLTFTSVYALLVQQDFFRHVDVGIGPHVLDVGVGLAVGDGVDHLHAEEGALGGGHQGVGVHPLADGRDVQAQ